MKGFFETEKECHQFFYLSQLNEAYSAEKIDQNKVVKTYGRFVKLIKREDMTLINEEITKDSRTKLVVWAPRFLERLTETDEFSSSRMALFEDEGFLLMADIGNFSTQKFEENLSYMLYGRFNFVENGTPVFFVHVLSPTGDKDKNILRKTLEILAHYGVVDN